MATPTETQSTIILLKTSVNENTGVRLLKLCRARLGPSLSHKKEEVGITPQYDAQNNLIGIEISRNLSSESKEILSEQLMIYVLHIQQKLKVKEKTELQKPSILWFSSPYASNDALNLLETIHFDIFPDLKAQYPLIDLNPIYNFEKRLIGIDFNIELNDTLKHTIIKQINDLFLKSQWDIINNSSKSGEIFNLNDTLVAYLSSHKRFILAPLVCIIFASYFAYLTNIIAGIEMDASFFNEQELGPSAALYNALVIIGIVAGETFILLVLVKKWGLQAFKYTIGLMILVGIWDSLNYFISVVFYVYQWSATVYYFLFIFITILLIFILIMYLRNRLKLWQKNTIVLIAGITIGAIWGIMFPTWTTFTILVFLSLWDIFAVFKGPLGKSIEKIFSDTAMSKDSDLDENDSSSLKKEEIWRSPIVKADPDVLSELEVKRLALMYPSQLGIGDFVFYSAFVAHVLVKTGELVIVILVAVGILIGAILTRNSILKSILKDKKKMLPALPLSMFLGLAMYFLGLLIVWLLSL